MSKHRVERSWLGGACLVSTGGEAIFDDIKSIGRCAGARATGGAGAGAGASKSPKSSSSSSPGKVSSSKSSASKSTLGSVFFGLDSVLCRTEESHDGLSESCSSFAGFGGEASRCKRLFVMRSIVGALTILVVGRGGDTTLTGAGLGAGSCAGASKSPQPSSSSSATCGLDIGAAWPSPPKSPHMSTAAGCCVGGDGHCVCGRADCG